MAKNPNKFEIAEASVGEILSEICLQEARQLKSKMLKMAGSPPMQYRMHTFALRTLETPLFGDMLVDGVAYGWQAQLLGEMPPVVVFYGKKPPDEDFIDFSESVLCINRTGIDDEGQIVSEDRLAYIDTAKRLVYDDDHDNEHQEWEEEKLAELRVALEYGLQSLGLKPKIKL